MKYSFIAVLVISSRAVLLVSSALSCYNLEQSAGRSDNCYIQTNAEWDTEIVGTTPKCTPEDITQGIATPVTNGLFCFMAVFRGNASATKFNASTNTSTTLEHAVVLIQREAGIVGRDQPDCIQQCNQIAKIEDISNTLPLKRTMVYFACGIEDNTNGDDAEKYKSRIDKFDCKNFQLTQTAVKKTPFPLWLIIVLAVVGVLLVVLVLVLVWMLCFRNKKAEAPGAHPNAAYRPQQTANESPVSLNP